MSCAEISINVIKEPNFSVSEPTVAKIVNTKSTTNVKRVKIIDVYDLLLYRIVLSYLPSTIGLTML